jgi:hypothetical protein
MEIFIVNMENEPKIHIPNCQRFSVKYISRFVQVFPAPSQTPHRSFSVSE